MGRSKVLKGVAHDVGASFTSLMNYASDDYAMGHVLRLARDSGESTLSIDLLNGRGSPEELVRDHIADLPRRYSEMFLRLVERSGADRNGIRSATLTLVYDLQRQRPSPLEGEPQSPYTCEVSIVDSRGKEYAVRFDGWWFVESTSEILTGAQRIRACWNRRTWHDERQIVRVDR